MTEESKGLGDTIKKITNAVGIKQCGACKKRQEKLNKMFPYKTKEVVVGETKTSTYEVPADIEKLSNHDKMVIDNKRRQMETLDRVRKNLQK